MKKKMVKKMLAAGLSLSMCVGMLAGCGSQTTTTESTTTAETGSAAATTEAESEQASAETTDGEVPTLIWWTVGQTTPTDFEDSVEKISDYTEEKIGVRLDIKVAGYGDWGTKMNTIVNSGEYFDIMFMDHSNYTKFATLGALEPLNDLLPANAAEMYEFIPQELWDGVTINGNIYAVPSYKDSAVTQFWWLDDTYVQKYDIDYESVTTMDQLGDVFRTIKEGEGSSVYPCVLTQGTTWNGFFNAYDALTVGLPPMGVKLDDPERKVVCTLEQEDILHNLELLHEWYTEGLINPDANVMTESPKGNIFGNGQGWPSAVSSWQISAGVEKYDAWQVAEPFYTTDSILGSLNGVSVNSKYKEEALKVLNLINTDHTFRDMMAYGIEGDHFTYANEEKTIVTRTRDDWPLGAYTQGTFFIMSTTDDSDPNQWDEIKAQNESAISSSCLGFAMNIEPVQNEVANCLTVWEKYRIDMLTGASDPAVVVPECVEELKAAGLDTVMAEAQKQIDEYFANADTAAETTAETTETVAETATETVAETTTETATETAAE